MGTLTDQMAEFLSRGQQAQKTVDEIIRDAESRPDKRLAVSNWPAPKWSNPTVLDDEFAAYEADRLG
jgi:hypothetical protein